MNIQAKMPTTADELLRWNEGREGKREFVRGRDLAATEPMLLGEVLSPSSYGRDFVDKLADYRGVEPVGYCLILSQEGPRVWLSSRGDEGWSMPAEVADLDATIALEQFGATIALADVYDGVDLRSSL